MPISEQQKKSLSIFSPPYMFVFMFVFKFVWVGRRNWSHIYIIFKQAANVC